jgi:hypothetical protein
MAAPQTGIRLLSALRKARSKSSLYDTPRHYFAIEEEQAAFDWLRDFVESHNAWPSPGTFVAETGIQTVTTLEPLAYYKDKARKHALWEGLMPLYKAMRDPLKDMDPDDAVELARQMLTLSSEFNGAQQGLVSMSAATALVVEDYDIAKRSMGLRGIPTGFALKDEMTDGLQNANLYTTVARPGVGKTWKLLRQAKAAHDAGFSVLFLTMEMGIVQVMRRYLGMDTGINPRFLREGRLSTVVEQEMKRQAAQLQEHSGAPFWWLAGNFKKSLEALKAAAYQCEADLIIGDAAYLLKSSDRTKFNAKHEILGDVMQGMADLSTSLNRPVEQSVQFNRTAEPPNQRRPRQDEEEQHNPLSSMALSKIAGSDEIGQLSAYVEGLTWGDGVHRNDQRYAGVLKGREGEDGWYLYNYQFQPFNMDQIATHRDRRRGAADDAAPPDLSYMDAQVG